MLSSLDILRILDRESGKLDTIIERKDGFSIAEYAKYSQAIIDYVRMAIIDSMTDEEMEQFINENKIRRTQKNNHGTVSAKPILP